MLQRISVFILLLSLFASCDPSASQNKAQTSKNKSTTTENWRKAEISYANGFSIEYHKQVKVLRIFNPWQGAQSISATYVLYPRDEKEPTFNEPCIKIPIPIESIVCLSTTHIGFLEVIDELESIVGISGKELINNKLVAKKIEREEIIDVGYDQSLNKEILAVLEPDLIMAYSVNNELSSASAKLEEMGLSLVLNAEYLEAHPLGKSEWIKFVAAFYNKEAQANSYFAQTAAAYNSTAALISPNINRPTVMTGLPWKDTWYVPANDSYAAQLIKTAGGKYVWDYLEGNQPAALGIEQVYNETLQTDIWINAGIANNKQDITATDERLSGLKPLRTNRVYNNNMIQNPNGGNDYWESGLLKPHIILQDLIEIFHPELIDHELVYYKHLH